MGTLSTESLSHIVRLICVGFRVQIKESNSMSWTPKQLLIMELAKRDGFLEWMGLLAEEVFLT